MREKLLDLMKSEGLKPSQLAEMLEINPAGISHILAGRNKPGFDLLQKILRRFPRINPDWLMLDAATMYRDNDNANSAATTSSAIAPTAVPENLFDTPAISPSAQKTVSPRSEQDAATPAVNFAQLPVSDKSGVSVARVIILYDNHTFESFTPTQKKSTN